MTMSSRTMQTHPLLQPDTEDDSSACEVERKSATWEAMETNMQRSTRTWNDLRDALRWSTIIGLIPKKPVSPSLNPPARAASTSRTSSYDGLRGLACLIVFNFHFLYPYTKTTWRGYGVELKEREERWIHQFPILCLLVRGRAMVTLFFAISGYVLSYNFLASVRSGEWTKAVSRLSSLTLRRWMRLFLPASISMLLVCFGAYAGIFEQGRKLNNGGPLRTGEWEQHPPRFPNATAQIEDFSKMYRDWSSPWQWRLYYSPYDPHTWTIPVELRGSMVLFLLLLSSTALKQRWRTWMIFFVTIYWFYCERWEVATFTGGALVADLHQKKSPKRRDNEEKVCPLPAEPENAPFLPTEASIRPPTTGYRRKECINTALRYLLLVTGLYLLSYPDEAAKKTPGFIFLRAHTPRMYGTKTSLHFWHAIASLPILWSIEKLPPIRTFLSSPIPQYFGQISYGFYLVHGPLLHSVGFVLQPWIWSATGHETLVEWCFGLLIGWVMMLALSVGVGHLFWKFIDMPLVKAARSLERTASDHEAFQAPKAQVV